MESLPGKMGNEIDPLPVRKKGGRWENRRIRLTTRHGRYLLNLLLVLLMVSGRASREAEGTP
jgi:hypothetical protein